MVFTIFICFLVLLRVGELYISARNEKWLLHQGAVEYGKEHYPYIVLLHTFFIISTIVEYIVRHEHAEHYFLMAFFFVLILIKVRVIATLGKYWNTKIYKIPGSIPVNRGIYRYVKHPNYIIVIAEILIIPLIFNLYFTAILFSILNAIMLTVRIKKEEEILYHPGFFSSKQIRDKII